MLQAQYLDRRDKDHSSIGEFSNIDDVVDAIVRYFRQFPNSYEHMVSWQVVDLEDDEILVYQTSIDLS